MALREKKENATKQSIHEFNEAERNGRISEINSTNLNDFALRNQFIDEEKERSGLVELD